ncbi:MAG: hypothetical protein R3F13_06555 [Prosthecobacter sp.]
MATPSPLSPQNHAQENVFQARPMVVGFGISLVVVTVMMLAWKPVRDGVKRYWARQYAAKAIEASESKDWTQAFRHYLDARRWDDQDLEVLLTGIHVLDESGADPAGLVQLFEIIEPRQELSSEQRLTYAKTLARVGKTSLAREQLAQLTPEDLAGTEALQIQALLLKQEGDDRQARKMNEKAIAADQTSAEGRLQNAMQETSSPFKEVKEGATEDLWQIAALKTPVGLDAIHRLAQDPTTTASQARQLLEWVTNHPHRSASDRYFVLSAVMKREPENRMEILSGEVARFKQAGDTKLEVIALWLVGEKEYQLLTDLVPHEIAVGSRELYPIISQALASQKRWTELEKLMSTGRPPVSQARLAVGLAWVKGEISRDDPQISEHLMAGIAAAAREKDADTLINAASLADKYHLPDLALEAYMKVATFDPDKAVAVLQKAFEEAAILKNTEDLISISRRLHDLRPSSAVFAERLAYLRLVLGVEMETVDPEAVATVLAEKSGISTASTSLLRALAAYRLGHAETIDQCLGDLKVSSSMPPGQRAVMAGLLQIAGRAGEAFQIAEKVPESLLLDEERVFLKKAR